MMEMKNRVDECNIEDMLGLRICGDQGYINEGTLLYIIELFIAKYLNSSTILYTKL